MPAKRMNGGGGGGGGKQVAQHNMPGQVSLFRGKVRDPVSITLTPDHHAKVGKGTRRLGLTRSDFIGLLIEKYADTVKV